MGALWLLLALALAEVPEQVHLAFGTSAHSLSVQWVTFSPTTSSDVQLCQALQCRVITGSCQEWRFEDSKNYDFVIPRFMHTVEVADLHPGRTYSYRVGSERDDLWSGNFTFKGPANDLMGKAKTKNDTSFILLGDFGTCSDIPLPTLRALITEGESLQYDAFFHAGDIAYDLDTVNGVRGDDYMRSIEPFASRVPYMVAVGNHESGQNYTAFKTRYRMPQDHDSMFYSVNIGPVHVMVYSSEVFYMKVGKEEVRRNQREWMIEDLEQANRHRDVRPWIVAISHKPLYCSTDWEDPESIEDCTLQPLFVKREYEDMFAAYKVDVHFHGHVHCYERTVPLYQDYSPPSTYDSINLIVNPQAPIYVIDGIAGTCRVDDLNIPRTPEPWSVFRSSELGYTRIYANSTLLRIRHMTSADMAVEDFLYIVKTHKEPT